MKALLVLFPTAVLGACPFAGTSSNIPAYHPRTTVDTRSESAYNKDWDMDLAALEKDIEALLINSQDEWPADYGNYGPLMVRLAWHCSGSYRTSDGRGGCDGGRQRFDPERSWEDNTNLDKARNLLWPLKEKYGDVLSWGDLIVFTGTIAIKSMGGPILGFCAGRIDDVNGDESLPLGPTQLQEDLAPCPVNGECQKPLGSTTIGLIYVNPEGPMANPIPDQSAGEVRDTFDRMAMNDSETVALIGGGHSFGKTHGACPLGPGPSPKEDPFSPWPGACGTGKGKDAFTSGFEGAWTSEPTKWDYTYFNNLLDFNWAAHKGPGGHWQWGVSGGDGPMSPGVDNSSEAQPVMMMTSDISLLEDPTGAYQKLIQQFADDDAAFDNAFAHAWYKLTTRDMGPVTRCLGDRVPPAQDWQNPLPPPPAVLANFDDVRADLSAAMVTENDDIIIADVYDGVANYGPLFVRLAWQCASTFRQTDYLGGCNGARIRYSPMKDWPANAALDQALELLAPIKEKYGDGLSWADLIVLAGTTALETASNMRIPFCGGRTDAEDGSGTEYLAPRVTGAWNDTILALRDTMNVMGLTTREFTVLMGGGHSLGQMHNDRTGFTGAWTENPATLDNTYFTTLLSEDWEESVAPSSELQYKAKGKDLYMLNTDLMLRVDAEFRAVAEDYASDELIFMEEFALAWVKVMNLDRFDGPVGSVCES